MHRCRARVLTLALFLALPGAALADKKPPLAECRRLYAAWPDGQEGAKCLSDQEEDKQILAVLYQRHPERPWLALYLGLSLRTKDPLRAAKLDRQAAAQLTARQAFAGALIAWGELDFLALEAGRSDEAELDLAQAALVSRASRSPKLILKDRLLEARHLCTRKRFEEAYRLLRSIERDVKHSGDDNLEIQWSTFLGNSAISLGLRPVARAAYLRLADLAARDDDPYAKANARYNLAHLAINELNDDPSEAARGQARELARRALAAAKKVNHCRDEALASWILGMLESGTTAERYLRDCRSVAEAPDVTCYCSCALALLLAKSNPRQAEQLVEQGGAAAREADDPAARAYALWTGIRVSWASQSTSPGSKAWTAAFDAIDSLRSLQPGRSSQAGVLASWSEDPYWLSGSLLARPGRTSDDIAESFAITERQRWRTLLDALENASVAPEASVSTQELQKDLARVLEDIAAVQKILLDPDLSAAARQAKGGELEELQRREQEFRESLSKRQPAFAALHSPHFATLREVQASLARDQAMLSFQVAPTESWTGDFAGGSWLLVITHGDVHTYGIPERGALNSMVQGFLGLCERRDRTEREPAAALYRQLVGAALGELPGDVRRLIIIPDGLLHQLPFGALRATKDTAPLATRYQISVAPSATLWRRWIERRPQQAEDTVLVLADPSMPYDTSAASPERTVERGGLAGRALIFRPLPQARQEGEAALAALGGGRMLVGAQATKAALQSASLERFCVLHFATHSFIDEENPENSGVLLAPAPGSPDGLLQPRDIVELRLAGKVVALSSCSSARGFVLPGEGVMGLARSFFQAGAHAVLGSLWPVRDDEAALLFERFYAHLADRQSVAEALASAQRDRFAAGAPPAAWAGFVVLGDGDLVPLPDGPKHSWQGPALAAGACLLACLALGAAYRRARVGL